MSDSSDPLCYFKEDEQYALAKIFKMYDKNQDELLNREESIAIIQTLGINDITIENFDEFYDLLYAFGYTNTKSSGLDANRNISFSNFLQIMKYVKLQEGSLQISSFIKTIEKENVKKENESILENPERTAYINVINALLSMDEINNKYLPIDPNSNELFDKIIDGILLCRLINKAKKDLIDERTINKNENMTIYQKEQNLKLAISSAKSMGLRCGEISFDIIIEKSNLNLILNFIGEICKFLLLNSINLKNYPELINVLNKNEEKTELLKLSPENMLLKWFNFHLKAAGYDKSIINFSQDIKDSEKYIILLNQLNKDICNKEEVLNEADLKNRAEKILEYLSKLNINPYISSNDIVEGNEKLNILLVASIFNKITGLKPLNEKQKKEVNNILMDEDEKEEKMIRIWINSLNLKNEKDEEITINNLYEESKDGILLLRIIEKLKVGVVKWKVVKKKPRNPFDININCNEVIDSCKKLKFSIVGVGSSDIREGRKKYILSIAWQMMKMYLLQIIGKIMGYG